MWVLKEHREGRRRRWEAGIGNAEQIIGQKRTFGRFCLNTLIWFRNRIKLVRRNQRELITDAKRASDSCMRFCKGCVSERME